MTSSTLWWKAPAPNWIQAWPVGDGRLGAKVHGGVDHERLALNIETLWSGKPLDHNIKDGPATLQAIRSKLLDGDHKAADDLVYGLQGPFNNAYQPLGDLLIDLDGESETKDYRTELDLAAGVVTTTFRRDNVGIRRRALVSRDQRAIVVLIDADREVSLKLKLETPHPVVTSRHDDRMIALAGFAPATVDRKACHGSPDRDPSLPGMTYTDDAGVGFAAVLKVSGAAESRFDNGALLVRGKTMVLRVTAATTFQDWRQPAGRDLESALAAAVADADAAEAKGAADVIERQGDLHGKLFDRVTLTLDTPVDSSTMPMEDRVALVRDGGRDPGLHEALYKFARYLLISSSSPGSALPANLQGIWNENRNPPWFASFTTNINVQMNYWLAEPGNLSECADPYLDYIESLAEAGTAVAKDVFGLDGWCANHNADIWRAAWPSGGGVHRPTWSFEPTCGMWLSASFIERDNFQPDDAFLRDRALPLYEGAARFAMGLLIRADRGLIVAPSTSPENNYTSPSGDVVDFDLQTTFDLWMVREVMGTYLDLARRFGRETEFTTSVAAAFSELEEPRIGEDGRLMEWSQPFAEPEPGHRHLSHLYGLYPGNHIDPVSTPELAQAVARSLEARMAGGAPIGGWTHSWMTALFARLFDAGKASWVAHNLIRTNLIGSGLSYQSFRGIHQIDANFGIGNGVSEMLLQSHRGVIRPLPALPAEWTSGRYSGFRARGGAEVAVDWADGKGRIDIVAARAGTFRVAYPAAPAEETTITLAAGQAWRGKFALPTG